MRLSGPRLYDGEMTEDPWLNANGNEPTARDIAIGLSRYNALLLALAVLLLACAIING